MCGRGDGRGRRSTRGGGDGGGTLTVQSATPHTTQHVMYSLWFLRDTPDVLIVVGSGRSVHQFAGHRTLLASHSGYLKSQLTPDTHQVTVPNVSPEVFAPLLTFMYTGYLDLTPENIYAVLLATHLLHMPRASDLCRAYLVQSQQTHPPTLVKPVPSRKPLHSILPAAPSGLYWAPPTFLPDTPFRPVFSAPSDTDPAATESAPPTSRESPPAVPSTSGQRPPPPSPPPSSLSPCLSQGSDASDRVTVTVSPGKSTAKNDGKVIVDVACCDGPVRFHRVLNRNYPGPEGSADNDKEGRVYTCRFCDHTFKSHYCYQKHARRHLNPVPAKSSKPKPAKREVRLLDMNVQYYPCKTCGSKFPSYYFVHKHRKMCHPQEETSTTTSRASSVAGPSDTSVSTV
ncbi:hypermethylated in cancer 1 protein [Macrosteles quadrilineatus]|uniref:hypermethylated in cancer 1 protein n=1 Tax=Macrosteles quadrilineatus TaxID=74068 RepID=UPI0023E0F0BD|nr:hypermethylated in cancer 1 protein [Macrosteles quadrilineatus]